MLMHGAEGGKGISYDKATHGKVSEVFFEQVAKSRRQGISRRYSWEPAVTCGSQQQLVGASRSSWEGSRYSWELAGTRGR
jgi:hypothetical protein